MLLQPWATVSFLLNKQSNNNLILFLTFFFLYFINTVSCKIIFWSGPAKVVCWSGCNSGGHLLPSSSPCVKVGHGDVTLSLNRELAAQDLRRPSCEAFRFVNLTLNNKLKTYCRSLRGLCAPSSWCILQENMFPREGNRAKRIAALARNKTSRCLALRRLRSDRSSHLLTENNWNDFPFWKGSRSTHT